MNIYRVMLYIQIKDVLIKEFLTHQIQTITLWENKILILPICTIWICSNFTEDQKLRHLYQLTEKKIIIWKKFKINFWVKSQNLLKFAKVIETEVICKWIIRMRRVS
jgi:hypothetical protein